MGEPAVHAIGADEPFFGGTTHPTDYAIVSEPMSWEPISETSLCDLINQAQDRMSVRQRRLWDALRITPIKWQLEPWGDLGNGFWVAGVIGKTVLWYNDIEHGFNWSKYTVFGRIDEYWCNQDNLEWSVQQLINGIRREGAQAGSPGF